MKKVILSIGGMTCAACSSGLEKYLNKQHGIKHATVNLVMNTASIEYDDKDLKISDLDKYVEKAGFVSYGIDTFEKQQRKNKNEKYKLALIAIFSIIIMIIAISHINCPFILLCLTSIVLLLGNDIIKSGIKNLLHSTPNMDTLVSIGALASFIYSIYETVMIIKGNSQFVGNLYFDSAAMVIFFIKIGKFIENKNISKSKDTLKELVSITPKEATIIKEGMGIKVTLDEIQKGDTVLCKPGEKIAVDGTIIDGKTHIDESLLTGESIPVKKEKGSKVIAGSINYEGTIRYKAEKIGKESTVSEIVRQVINATNTKAPIAKIADKISGYFVPIVIIISVLAFTVWFSITKDFSFAINIFVSVLVVACPCSLGLATPLAIVIASGKCSQRGILIKSSEVLENASKVKTIAFDKTGTITQGKLTISKVISQKKDIIKEIASIEKNSEHPIGKAIVNYAYENNIKLEKTSDFKAIPGEGVYAKIQDDEYYIGNRKLMLEKSIAVKYEKEEDELTQNGNSVLFVSKNNEIIALIGVKDIIRKSAKKLIKEVKQKNIEIAMITGDNEKTSKYIANEIGISTIISNVKPNEKAEQIKKLQKKGLVMMCGDGINDSISIVTSDIGVSISNATDIAIDSANVVLMNDNLENINDLIIISKKTIQIIKQNLFWAFFYNICMIPIAARSISTIWNCLEPNDSSDCYDSK